ncbi:MAG: single-stranded DNA-binding protein [Candidatus Nealsonbacteria bacterium CG23_combo_of_CG06-09_8_20_14_all_39_17]|uniref:Single-stranded DNA-binding protein n=1 Tax=Candidatus Nealsonbacteria bacterium CG23_combo_of_CG06-09_8_20_14_all_39_17 TaxID=1974722 RepID=A0A2G9YUK4_9BACT|nr:MAG: single-stranded DNA-binding protein [Candidatus Nealsonbacteria bacterium CG23_combo_of_CG06-09_8_20_14_all_39_17]PIU44127.1 MAG: single-stranded DNA-binding protein [Candidatus Nealsonbacteria bacterium CG07_land_8_20_14_0_80_39_13]
MNLNKVLLIGRLTRDPENKSLPSGQQVTSFGMATDRYYTSKQGEKQQKTEFHNIVCFGRLAEISSQYMNKGSLVFIEGRLQTRNWNDASGNKKYRTEIIAERLQLGPRSAGSAGSPAGGIKTEPNIQRPASESKHFNEVRADEDIPIIEENEEIDVKDIPF